MIKEYLMSGGLTHVHTDLSKDGKYSMGQICDFVGRNMRSGYFAVADHLTSPYNNKIFSTEDAGFRVSRMLTAVHQCNSEHSTGPLCISGVEVNIKPDGLDIPDGVLEQIDFVVASRHFPWGNEDAELFEQNVENAMNNPNVDVIGHIDRYSPANVNWGNILSIAKETNTIVEVNLDSPPRQEVLDYIKILHLPTTIGVDFHTFNGWLRNQKQEKDIETQYHLPLSYASVKRAVSVIEQVSLTGIETDQVINLKNKNDFINLLRTKKNDRKF